MGNEKFVPAFLYPELTVAISVPLLLCLFCDKKGLYKWFIAPPTPTLAP